MKKKLINMILVFCMACSMAACGKQEEITGNNKQTEDNAVSPSDSEDKEQEEKEASVEEWGLVYGRFTRNKADEAVWFYINYPTLMPHNEIGICEVTYQKDSSLVVKLASWYEKYEIDSLETMLEDGNELVCEAMWDYYEGDFDYDTSYVVSIEVESTELTTINEFPMCKYVGATVFDNGETKHSIPFVGYAADLQVGEGAYVMWMVCDNSEFSKLAPLEEGVIEEYALKMAESLKISED